MRQSRMGPTTLTILQGDITQEAVDAIVNAANTHLIGGGGVDGAIHRAGGPQIMAECDAIRARDGGCPTGSAVITTAGKLSARAVLHAVGPVWDDDRQEECDTLLASCYRASLQLAVDHQLRRIAFPAISTGIYGFPIERAAAIVIRTIHDFVELVARTGVDNDLPLLEEVRLVLFSPRDFSIFAAALDALENGETTKGVEDR